MSRVTCAVCGSTADFAFSAHDRNRSVSQETFTYWRCTSCRTISLSPVPADLSRYYPPEYYSLPADRDELLSAAQSERYKVDLLRPFASSGRLVEVGPAVGAFSVLAQQAGYETSAIEMDADCCRFLREVVGVAVHQSAQPAEVLSAHGPFDVVAMWHVIEHVPEPAHVLVSAASALAPGGVIVLATPNPDAFQFRVLGARWAHVDAPRHLFLMPPDALSALGRRLGLEVVLLTTRDPGTLNWNWFGWRESLAGLARRAGARQALRRIGSIVSRAMVPFDRRAGRGSTYTLVLRKPLG